MTVATEDPRRGSLGEVFDPRQNSLNALRLLLAVCVILQHAYALSGNFFPNEWIAILVGNGPVDGFFTISGFLITRSWLRRPQVWPFLRARFARILPAFWVCLFVTAFLIVPLSIAAQGGYWQSIIGSGESWNYVWSNFFLKIHALGMSGVWDNVPYPGVINGSLWTLYYEFGCYLVVLVIGAATLLRRRYTVAILFAASWLFTLYVHLVGVTNYDALQVARFTITFFSGAMIYRYRDRLKASWILVVLSVVIVIASAVWAPDYRMVSSLFLAYALITVGSKVKNKRLNLTNDISYGVYIYGFPFQQLLVASGFAGAGPLVFFVVCVYMTAPAAILSWFLVEKPILSRIRGIGLSAKGSASGDEGLEVSGGSSPGLS